MIEIRHAVMEELPAIEKIYERARAFMRETGNPTQWRDQYPPVEQICADLASGNCFVLAEGEQIHAVFSFFTGEDPTYQYIEDGAWLNGEPYVTIHRIASAGTLRHAAARCFAWAYAQHPNVRIDTHANNRVMQHVLETNGFQVCGRIYTEKGEPRIAYQKSEG